MNESPKPEPQAKWLTSMGRVEGLHLALRLCIGVDTPANRTAYPDIALISHEFIKTMAKSYPAPNYNDSMDVFDAQMLKMLDGMGLFVLVESLGGRRNYYAYVAHGAPVQERVEELMKRYPRHKLTVRCGRDSGWQLYEEYRGQFPE